MKKTICILVLLLSTVVSAQQEITSTFAEKWDNSKIYLLEIAKAMPENKYNYKPTAREMSFKEQVFHILENMDWLSTTYFSTAKYEKKDRSKITSKEVVIKEIESAFDKAKNIIKEDKNPDLNQKVDFFAGPKTRLQILNLIQDHVTHHRGQLIVYLNLNQIDPPKYVGW